MPMFSTFTLYIMYIILNRYTYLLIFFLVESHFDRLFLTKRLA